MSNQDYILDKVIPPFCVVCAKPKVEPAIEKPGITTPNSRGKYLYAPSAAEMLYLRRSYRHA